MSDNPAAARPGSLDGKTVYLHIGAPKTGTSYLQARLDANPDAVSGQGMLWSRPWSKQVHAAREVKALAPGDSLRPDGPWQTLVEEARAWSGPTVLISMEWLTNAAPQQVEAAVASLLPARVEIVCTARDVVRTLPAAWQESMQNYRTWTWHEYVDAVTAPGEPAHPGAVEFWGQQDIARVARTWTTQVPADRFHVVTVPGRDGGSGLLWERFCSVVGLDGAGFAEPRRSNPSLGVVSAALMQRVNVVAHERDVRRKDYHRLVKHTLSKGILAERRKAEGAIAVPDEAWQRLAERSRVMVAELEQLPVPVVGDLADLLPEPAGPGTDPQEVTEQQMLEAAVDGLVGLVLDSAARERRLQQKIEALGAGGGRWPDRLSTLWHKARARARRGVR
ncbi:MAG TPA: hypothetical protein VLA97_10010 [Nocardioidaceae bacterium]|nr:hypothetical protein [Nocardioidaceae bacterium]